MRREIKVLLGATKDETLVFANVNLGDSFSVSFDEVSPSIVSDEYLRERVCGLLECYGKDDLYDMCDRYDCRPSELENELYHQIMHYGDGVYEIIDISLYPESFRVEGIDDDIYFESDGCGQCDTRERLIPIDENFSNWLHKKWDMFHLKTLDETQKLAFEEVVKKYADKVDETEWIQNWLETVVYAK